MRYHKLVRDNIPEIIEKNGGKPVFHMAEKEEFLAKLREKLMEEAREFIETESAEEMADLFEVIHTLLSEKGWSVESIIELQKKKRLEKGGFEKRIILEEA